MKLPATVPGRRHRVCTRRGGCIVLKLVRRARGEVAELRAQIGDLEAQLARYHAAESTVQEPTPMPVEEPAVEEDDWALAAVGRSPTNRGATSGASGRSCRFAVAA